MTSYILKGTHNSYACGDPGSNSCPVKRNPPAEQLDNYGAWQLELDGGPVIVGTDTFLVIGHDEAGGWTSPEWGYDNPDDFPRWKGLTLDDFLIPIRDSEAFKYRPVFIYWDDKCHDGGYCWGCTYGCGYLFNPYPENDPAHMRYLERALHDVFSDAQLSGPTSYHNTYHDQWPDVHTLAGKLIVWTNLTTASDIVFTDDNLPEWPYVHSLERTPCPNWDKIAEFKANGSNTIIKTDEYAADWTYDNPGDPNSFITAPPNPIHVDPLATPPYSVVNPAYANCDANCYPELCTDSNGGKYNTDPGQMHLVGAHGTVAFPLTSLTDAVSLANPGWTILLRPGAYREVVRIAKALTLRGTP